MDYTGILGLLAFIVFETLICNFPSLLHYEILQISSLPQSWKTGVNISCFFLYNLNCLEKYFFHLQNFWMRLLMCHGNYTYLPLIIKTLTLSVRNKWADMSKNVLLSIILCCIKIANKLQQRKIRGIFCGFFLVTAYLGTL